MKAFFPPGPEDSRLQVVNVTLSSLVQLSVTHLEVAWEPGILEGKRRKGSENRASQELSAQANQVNIK